MKRNTLYALVALLSFIVAMVLLVACQQQATPAPDVAGMGARTEFREVYVQNDVTVDDAVNVGGRLSLNGATTSGLFSAIVPTTAPTATPGVVIQNKGLGNSLELQNASGTPVFQVSAAGNVTYSGFTSAGGLSNNAGAFAAPTAVATATPAFFVDNAGVSNLFEVRKNSTPVVQVLNDGSLSATGAWTSGQTNNNWVRVAAPTAIATATPAVVIDNAGVSALLEIRDSATPVARFPNGGGFLFTGLLNGTAAAEVTVLDATPFAIGGTFQPITAAGAVAPTITIPAAGVVACIYNTSANTITIADSGNQVLTASAVLGQYDMLCGYSDGTRFIEFARANN